MQNAERRIQNEEIVAPRAFSILRSAFCVLHSKRKGGICAALSNDDWPCLERGVKEWTQLFRSRRMPQLAQGLRLDLSNALARDVERAADLFQRVLGAVADAKAHLQHLLFARCQSAQNFVRLLFQIGDDDVVDR